VSERLHWVCRGVRGGVQGGGAPRAGVWGQCPRIFFFQDDIFPGRQISGTTYFQDDIFLGPYDI
jgi:hypothetical protein